MDPEERLRRIVKDTGEVDYVLGGFEIKILKPALFPWFKTMNQLIEIGQNVWVSKKEGKVYITSEPKV
jgi:hypothetical protein